MGPYARAYCFYATIGKKFMNRPGGDPLVPQWKTTQLGVLHVQTPKGPQLDVLHVRNAKSSASSAGTRPGTLKREYCRNPTWEAPKVS